MNRRGENTPRLLSRLAYRLVGKQHPTIRRSPAPQTSLSTSSSISTFDRMLTYPIPSSQFSNSQTSSSLPSSPTSPQTRTSPVTTHGTVFKYCMDINDNHQRRMEFLLRLSGTCRTMRLRLVPWIWDHIQPSRASYRYYGGERTILWSFPAITQILSQNNSLARVKYSYVLLCPWVKADPCPLKVHDSALPGLRNHCSAYRMPEIPPKSPHARNRVVGIQF